VGFIVFFKWAFFKKPGSFFGVDFFATTLVYILVIQKVGDFIVFP